MVEELISALRHGDESAWFVLVELDGSFIPELIAAYRACDAGDVDTRLALIEAIWQHRYPDALDFLLEALRDKNSTIWKAALDGFFALDADNAIRALEAERNRCAIDPQGNRERLKWLDEAITQMGRG